MTLLFVAGLYPALLFFFSVPRGIPRVICLRLLARHCMSVSVLTLSCVRHLRCRSARFRCSVPRGILIWLRSNDSFREREDYVPDKERELRYSPS